MRKANNFLFVVVFIGLFILAGCEVKEYVVIIENKTNKDINLISFSKKIKNEAPILLKPHDQVLLFSDIITSGIDISFSYNGKRYSINTGYADDYWRYTIRFLESDTSIHGIECFFIVKHTYGTEINPIGIVE